jgi:hypothetical protein
MNMDEYESKPPQYILDRIGSLLAEDGFRQSIPALFVKNLDADWRAWLAVPGYPHALLPIVGVYNEALVQIAHAAKTKLGRPSQQSPDSGPPLIMANLEQIVGDDPECKERMTWDFHAEPHHVADPTTIPELKPSAADDLVYCLRKKAYPFFASHMTFQSIWDAARERMGSPAFYNYFPIMLIKLGRRDDIPRLIEEQTRRLSKHPKLANNYKEYVEELLKLLPA